MKYRPTADNFVVLIRFGHNRELQAPMNSSQHKYSTVAILFLILANSLAAAQPIEKQSRSLAGEWRFEMDRTDSGLRDRWFTRPLADRISLPGTLQSQGFGDEISIDTPWVAALPRDMRWYQLPQYKAYTTPGNVKMPYLAQPRRHYLGVAWYQREIEIDSAWQGLRVELTLERPHWETTVWVDDQKKGSCTSLVAPHIYDLGTLTPGKHQISVRIDNRMVLPYRPDAHSVSDAEAQSWNGITGNIQLAATTPVWIEDAQAYPNIENKSVRIHVTIGNSTRRAGAGTLAAGERVSAVQWGTDGGEGDIEVSLPSSAREWSEFSPILQQILVHLTGDGAEDSREVKFGLREIKRVGAQMALNGTLLNLRGTHDGGGFPLSGYPATDVESWKRIIGICKEWGLNNMRFHSWCPPEAAFIAADELGFYLQPECGMWNNFDRDGRMLQILNDETARLIKAYGNHPSFILLGSGNEPAGDYRAQLPIWDEKWRELDSRRLYTDGVGRPAISATQPSKADYAVSADWGLAGRVRGPAGWFGLDYRSPIDGLKIPLVAHELGQWCAYPDFDVIAKFTGQLRPGNYEIYRDSAAAHGLLKNNKRLAQASGRFQLNCYKEEIEANLRTPGMSGFQLLDLHDYLGQGFSPIGLLDAFWESKGYVDAREFRRFCNVTVPLARLQQRVFTSSQTLTADVELAHFGPAPLPSASPQWRIEDKSGKTLLRGDFPSREIPIGKNIPLGKVVADLAGLAAPAEYKLVVGLKGTDFENGWNFWLYHEGVDPTTPDDILVTSAWPEAEARLRAGGRVLFQPSAKDLDENDPAISTTPIFWNWVMNGKGTTFLGLWCDASHPALGGFPTASFCDWQWIDLMREAHALNLDHLPQTLQPIVQSIDEWNRNYKLGLIYECKVGTGRLLVCSADLTASRPTALALRKSLLDYLQSDRFLPSVEIPADVLRNQWVTTRARQTNEDPEFEPSRSTAPEVSAPPQIPTPNR